MSQLLLDAIVALIQGLTNLIPWMDTTNLHLQNITQPPPPPAPTNNYKPTPPWTYDGDPNHVKACVQEHKVYFALAKITDEQQKILVTLSNVHRGLKDWATIWSNAIWNQILIRNNKRITATALQATILATVIPPFWFNDFNEFSAVMIKQFGLLNAEEEAIEAIHLLEQGNMTCEEYATIFQTYAIWSGYNKLGCLYEFKWGLNKQLQMKLETTDPAPVNNADGTTNSQNWIEKAVQIDWTWRITQWNEKGRGSPFTQNNYQQNDNR